MSDSADPTSELAEMRRERFKLLIRDLKGFDNAASLLGCSRGKLSRLANGAQKNSRSISDSEAREFEEKTGKPLGWLDGKDAPLHEQAVEPSSEHINLTIEEDIPPRAHGIRMKDYGEMLLLEAWSHRLRVNAILHRGLNSIINVSIWRSGWLSVVTRGQLTSKEAADVVTCLRAMKDSIHAHSEKCKPGELVIFPSDTVIVGAARPQDVTYLIDPKPAPARSIHISINHRQFQRAEKFGDLVAVFQISLWGDGTLRGAFSGFPLREDAIDAEGKIGQLCDIISANLEVHRIRQAN